MTKLIRGLSLPQAVAVNMLNMVGIGPFITIPFIIGAMQGPQCIIAWLLGALLAFMDGTVWAELGAKWPEAGGSYVFLQHLYGRDKWGRLMAFLYTWQATIQAPLVVASGAIGFSQYLTYLVPLGTFEQKAVSGALVILVTAMLYRKITDIGKISVFLSMIVGGTLLWLIFSGLTHFDKHLAFAYPDHAFDLTPVFFVGLGQATIKTVYSYLGYYNVCQLGGEIKNPEHNIPRSIFISVGAIAVLYILMQLCISAVIPWQEAMNSSFIVSTFFERIYGPLAAKIATGLILLIALSSVFAVMLGNSRVQYAAALDGNFFSVFGKMHSTKHFPYVSLLMLGGVAFIFSLLFKMKEVITAIIIMRILVQFLGQSIGIIKLHFQKKKVNLPYRMWLFPLPPIVAIIVWVFIFFSAEWEYIAGALGVIVLGVVLFLIQSASSKRWPFEIDFTQRR